MKIIFMAIVVLVLAGGPVCGATATSAPTEERQASQSASTAASVDQAVIAAQNKNTLIVVNGEEIPRWMFNNAFKDVLRAEGLLEPGPDEETANAIRQAVIDNIITMELLMQEAVRQGVAVDMRGGKLRSMVVQGRHENAEAFRRALAEAGMTEDQYIAIWRQQVSVNRLLDEIVFKDVNPTESELWQRYAEDRGKYLFEDGTPAPFEEVRERIAAVVVMENRDKAFESLKQRLANSAEIRILDPELERFWE
jgi:hypothetical protein